MEAYLPQTVLPEHYREVIRYIVGTYQLSHSVHADVFLVLLAVPSAEGFLHFSLMFSLGDESLFDYGYQRKRSVRRFRFHNIVACNSVLVLQDLVLDAYSLAYEVHRRPFQSDDLAAAEPVVGSYNDYDVQRIVLCAIDELLYLLSVIVVSDELHRLRAVSLIDRICRNDTSFHGRLECKVQERMVPLTGSTFHTSAAEISVVFVYMLEKNTKTIVDKPAADEELFTFAADANWKDKLNSGIMERLSALVTDYERCLSRIRACSQPINNRQRRSDIQRILYSQGRDIEYDTDSLYTLFQSIPSERITAIRQELQAKNWHLTPKEQREDFLADLIPELERYYPLFSDFRFGG